MNIIENLNWRYAVKKFSEELVPKDDLQTLKEAINLTASSYGLQPYKVIIITSTDIKKALLPYSYQQEKVVNCSHLFVFAAETTSVNTMVDRYIKNRAKAHSVAESMFSDMANQIKNALNSMDDNQRKHWAHQQAFIALGNLLTSAAIMNIDTCPMGGFEADGYDKTLGLTEISLTTSVICPIGYRHPDDRDAYKPKVRMETTLLFDER